jgi:hypothetical protein
LLQERTIQRKRRKPAMEPSTMPAMAPPERVLALSGSLGVVGGAVLVPVIIVTVLPSSGLVWVWRGCRVRVGGRVSRRVCADRGLAGTGAMVRLVVLCGLGGQASRRVGSL